MLRGTCDRLAAVPRLNVLDASPVSVPVYWVKKPPDEAKPDATKFLSSASVKLRVRPLTSNVKLTAPDVMGSV